MKQLLTLSALAAGTLVLAACNKTPDAATNADGTAADTAATPVELPPAVVGTKTYRCKDNSVVAVDFLSKTPNIADAMMANVHVDGDAAPTKQLTKTDAEGRFEAEGYSVSGSGDSVTIEVPGKNAQLCKA